MNIRYDQGDVFGGHIQDALERGLVQHGDKWGFWGRWVYDTDREGDPLIALFTRPFSKDEVRACAIRPGYEDIVESLSFIKRK